MSYLMQDRNNVVNACATVPVPSTCELSDEMSRTDNDITCWQCQIKKVANNTGPVIFLFFSDNFVYQIQLTTELFSAVMIFSTVSM